MSREPTRTEETAAIVEAAEAFLSSICGFDPSSAEAGDCVTVAEAAARVAKAAEALRLLAGARAVALGAHSERGVADPLRWLARQGGTTGTDARQGIELARSLELHPETKDALLCGAVSVAQAREIAKADVELPGSEHGLLDVARSGDLGAVRDAVREQTFAATSRVALHRRQLAARSFRHWRDALGMICFAGALPPEAGIPLVNRIERDAARLHKGQRRTGPKDRFEACAADALVSLCLGTASGGVKRSANVELVVVCDLYAFRRGHAHHGEPCHLVGGGPVPVEVAKALSADAFLKAVLHDGNDIRRVKHFGRRYTAELLTALNLGPVPAFSGRACANCKQTWRLQFDHDLPVAANGPTSVDNIKDLCVACHAEKTQRDRKVGLLGPKAKAREPRPPPPGPP